MEIIPPVTHMCLFTSFYISHNKYYSYYYYITDIDATKPVHLDSDSSDLPDIPPPDQCARRLRWSPGKGLGQSSHLHNHTPHFSAHQKRTLIQLLHQQAIHSFQGKNKIL